MNTVVKIAFYANFTFWGGGFLIAFAQYVAYNGIGNIFEYVKPEYVKTYVEIDSIKEIKTISYIYRVGGKEYNSEQSLYIDKIQKFDFYESNVVYNQQIPFLSYIGNKKLKLRSPTSGMIVFGFFFLFIFCIYKFADMNKWIGVYARGEYKSSKNN